MLSFRSYAQSISWAQGFVTGGIGKVAIDINKNLFILGGTNGTIDVDASSNIYNITSVGAEVLFLIKEDEQGNFQWAKEFQAKSATNMGVTGFASIALDNSGNIYVAGRFRDTVDFDPGINTYYMTAPPAANIFIVKLNFQGNFIWAKQIGGAVSVSTNIFDIKVKSPYIYFYGASNGILDVDPGPAVVNLNSGGIIEKLDTAGNYIWAKQGLLGASIAVDSLQNLYGASSFSGTVDFDPGPGMLNFTAQGISDIAVVKLDSFGNLVWAKQIGSGSADVGQGISLDPSANVLVTGYFGGTVDFDPGPGTYNLTSNSTRSAFTLKLNNNGDFKWAKMAGGFTGLFDGRAIATDSAGNVYTALELPGSCDINPGAGVFIVPAGVAVQKLDSSGNFVWGAGWQGDIPGWIGLDHDNSVYTTGTFSGANKDFDPGPGTFLLTGSSQGSGFIEKLCQNPANVALSASATSACTGDTITLTAAAQGNSYRWYRNGTALTDSTSIIKVTTSGTYTVEAGTGCKGYNTTTVTFWQSYHPAITLGGANITVPTGQVVWITAAVTNGSTGDTIYWYKNGVADPTNHTTSLQYFKTPGTDTIIAVVRKGNNPCYVPDTSNKRIISDPTGINDLDRKDITVSPNPSSGIFTFSSPAIIDKIEITDPTGKQVITAKPNVNSLNMDLSGKAAGLYFYTITVRNKKLRGKLVKQ